MGAKIIRDDFLDDFEAFRQHCDGLAYAGVENPADGVFYPGVDLDIPETVKAEILGKLEQIFDAKIIPNALFLRLSTQGIHAPHQAHTDAIMGRFSLMLYLNRLEDCEGGTSFVRHTNTGLMSHPINQKQAQIWEKDHSNSGAWDIWDYCNMYPNRACVFRADLMHRSEPVGGFGETAKNGRLVLVCFFDLEEK